MIRICYLVMLLFLQGLFSHLPAQSFTFTQSHADGIYNAGDSIVVTAIFDEIPSDSVEIVLWKNQSERLFVKRVAAPDIRLCVFREVVHEACALRLQVRSQLIVESIGFVVDPASILPGFKKPQDFDAFWAAEKRQLNSIPLEIISEQYTLSAADSAFGCWDIALPGPKPKPARGYFAKPLHAPKKSLPALLMVHAAGVKGDWCLSKPAAALRYAKMGQGVLCLDLNAHGMLNGQPAEYYAALEEGELKNYATQGLKHRDSIYFKGMYLRLLRAIEFLTAQPEWDGRRLLVIGESQGGGQALAAAGLDRRVSAVVATVPAMCDFGGLLANRRSGWPQPLEYTGNISIVQKALPYFDTAFLLEGSVATLVVEIGLIDQTCPPASIFAAINRSAGKRVIYTAPYRTHSWPEKYRARWDEEIYKPKEAFIQSYLQTPL